jgi:2,4-dienoyl-CoA reductase-like NADH-dependent reductase (Old Yellow Enzyme family)
MPSLFDPIRLGAIEAPNRVLMAPLTRTRGTRGHAPTEVMARYYAQRASAGLIISEAIGISRQGLGWPHATGLWRADQIDGWRRVTQAVHAAGGRIIAQLWHMGRMVHPDFMDGETPVSASATQAPGRAHTYDGRKPYAVSRPLRSEEIAGVIGDYRQAAANALDAGFDGVQVHAANGYLLDQFLRDNANFRSDDYGGAIVNRIRLLGEVTAAVIEVAGPARTSVRLSPNGDSQGVNDSDPEPLFRAAAGALSDLEVGFLELREPPRDGTLGQGERDPLAPAIRTAFKGPLVLNSDYDQLRAEAAIESGLADAVSFGRLFIANPDLPRRFADALPLHCDDKLTWYSQSPKGYVDYPLAG